MKAAREKFERGLDLQPDNVYLLQSWAVAEGKAGNYEHARRLFEKCSVANAGNIQLWHARGMM